MKALSIGSFNSYWKVAVIVSTAVSWSLPVWNMVVNPYQVFNQKFSIGRKYESSTTNERYLKTKFLLSEGYKKQRESPSNITNHKNSEPSKERHNAFIVGSSVMGLIDPVEVDRYFPNMKFYNLAFLAARPDEILATLQALKNNGVPIKTVVYGVEPIAFTDIKTYGPAYQLHYEADKKHKLKVLFDFMFAPSLSDGFSRLVNVINGQTSVRYDIEGSGRYFLERYDKEIELNHLAYMEKKFPLKAKHIEAPPWINERFSDFKGLAEWLKSEGVKTIFYINPLHPYVADAYGETRLAEFKQKIQESSGTVNIKDCTKLLYSNNVNLHFYDYKHFLPRNSRGVVKCGIGEIS